MSLDSDNEKPQLHKLRRSSVLKVNVKSAPDLNVLKAKFHPIKLIKSGRNDIMALREQCLLRTYESWKRKKNYISSSTPMVLNKLLENRYYLNVDLLVNFEKFMGMNPLGPTFAFTSNTVEYSKFGLLSVDVCGRVVLQNFNFNSIDSFCPALDFTLSDPISRHNFQDGSCYGISINEKTDSVAIRTKSQFHIFSLPDLCLRKTVSDLSLNDFILDDNFVYTCTFDGSVSKYDRQTMHEIVKITGLLKENSFSWGNVKKTANNEIIFSSRNSMNLIDSRNLKKSVLIIDNFSKDSEFIGTVLPGKGSYINVITQHRFLTYDIRSSKNLIMNEKHDLLKLPLGSSGIELDNEKNVQYLFTYTDEGRVMISAQEESENSGFRGFPNYFEVSEVLNNSPLSSEIAYNRLSVPVTGLCPVPTDSDKLQLIAANAIGDLFAMTLSRHNHEKSYDSVDWLLDDGSVSFDLDWIEKWAKSAKKANYLKSFKTAALSKRACPPLDYQGIPIPQILSKLKKKNDSESSNLIGFKPIPLEEFHDNEAQRILKVWNNESLFDNLPSDIESDASFLSDSIKDRLSSVSESQNHYNSSSSQILPNDKNYTMKQFMANLQIEEPDPISFAPLQAGASQTSMPFSQSTTLNTSKNPVKKGTKRKRHVMGF